MFTLNNDRIVKKMQPSHHLSEVDLCVKIRELAAKQGLPVIVQQTQVKLGGLLSSAENAIMISNSQKSGYVKHIIYQSVQGATNFLYIYEVGESSNRKRDNLHKKLYDKNAKDAKEGGWGDIGQRAFGIIGSAIIPKSSNKAKLLEDEYYEIIGSVINSAINEVMSAPPISNTYSYTSQKETTNTYKKQTSSTVQHNQTSSQNTYSIKNPSNSTYVFKSSINQTNTNSTNAQRATTNSTTQTQNTTTVNTSDSQNSNSSNNDNKFNPLLFIACLGIFMLIVFGLSNLSDFMQEPSHAYIVIGIFIILCIFMGKKNKE